MLTKIKEIIKNPFQTNFLFLLLVINVIGSIWGYFWYGNQLAETPIYYWVFVPDCPFATSLMSVVLLLFLFGKRNSLLELITYTALIKYGSWTVFVLTLDGFTGGQITTENGTLLLSHLGMVIQGLFFIRFLELRIRDIVIVIPWMLLNDYMDYGAPGLHPYLPNPNHLTIVAIFTVSLTIIISFLIKLQEGKG